MMGDRVERVFLELDRNLSAFKLALMNAYLGSPLTGVRKSRAKYIARLRKIITKVFAQYPCNGYTVYDPAQFTAPGTPHTAEEVCRIDHLCVVKSDVFVCLATDPSCGLAIEANTAMLALVPRILIYPCDVEVSRMLTGTACLDIDPIVFRDPADLENQLRDKMQAIDREVTNIRPTRRRLMEDIANERRGRQVLRNRIRQKLTREELHRLTRVPEHIIRAIETHELFTIVVASPQWSQLAGALNCRIKQGKGNAFSLIDESPFASPVVSDSLENYLDFVIRTPGVDDRKMLTIWADYEEMQCQALAGRESLDDVVTAEAWKGIYESRKMPPTLMI